MKWHSLDLKPFVPVLVLVIAALVYVQYGFQGTLTRDHAIYL